MGPAKKTHPFKTLVRSTTDCSILTTTTMMYRSSSSSAVMTSIRPQTLNVNNTQEVPSLEAKYFIREARNAWQAKARCNVAPAEHVQELFQVLQINPSDQQIKDMLHTAKMVARKGGREWRGLTFSEFCVIASKFKRFSKKKYFGLLSNEYDSDSYAEATYAPSTSAKKTFRSRHKSTKSNGELPEWRSKELPAENKTSSSGTVSENGTPVEVFLGGSCNPTTWRKDVAIPALEKLGISFYNPQVSDWTPDLIELEHRAKEKAQVLFFVMDSETRASAGAIEAAHIAGQNSKQLVLVLHPYKPDQYILNEPLSHQEYIDLTRNQQILRELVTKRGLPVLDNIPSGLQRTKEILAGTSDPPADIAGILTVVRGAFDRVNPIHGTISLNQCQSALHILGNAESLLALDNIRSVISHIEALELSPAVALRFPNIPLQTAKKLETSKRVDTLVKSELRIDFDQFCILAAYLSVLQQEIHESGCISPIKGTNVPPPPVYLTNLQGFQGHSRDEITNNYYTKHNNKTSSEDRHNRDSGTSSPQPLESVILAVKPRPYSDSQCSKTLVNVATLMSLKNSGNNTTEEENDSNDSVISSSDSSINSYPCSGDSKMRDVYLGGSCFLRTKWRQEYAVPYLKSKNISFHLPALHESIQPSQLDLPDKSFEDSNSQGAKQSEVNLRRMERQKSHIVVNNSTDLHGQDESSNLVLKNRLNLYNPSLMDSSRVLLFVITDETRSLAPMTLAAHCIGLMYNVVLCVQMLPENCVIGHEKLTPTAIKDYNRGRSYLIDLAKRQGVPVFVDLKSALECTVEKIKKIHVADKN